MMFIEDSSSILSQGFLGSNFCPGVLLEVQGRSLAPRLRPFLMVLGISHFAMAFFKDTPCRHMHHHLASLVAFRVENGGIFRVKEFRPVLAITITVCLEMSLKMCQLPG